MGTLKINGKMIVEIRGWGWIQKLDTPEERQDSVGAWIASMLNKEVFGKENP